jgi:hypothetical protein
MHEYRNEDKSLLGCMIFMFIFTLILIASLYKEYLVWSFLLQ